MAPQPSYGFRLTIATLVTLVLGGTLAWASVLVIQLLGFGWFALIAALAALLIWVGESRYAALDPVNPLEWVWSLPTLWCWVARGRQTGGA